MVQNDSPDAVIFTCGEASFQDCLAAVKSQTLPPRRIHRVEHVYPQGRASQVGFEEMVRQGSRAYVLVDADMILHPHCFETLSAHLEADAGACWSVAGRLEDGIEGPVFGVKIFRTRVIADLGGFREVVGVSREFAERAERRGWKSLSIDDILGLHNPAYTPESAFTRYRTKSIRLKGIYGVSEKSFRLWHNQLKILIMHYANQSRNLPALPPLAALAGLFCGILAEKGALEDYGKLIRSSEYRAYMKFFAHHADPPADNGADLAESRSRSPLLNRPPEVSKAADAPEPAFIGSCLDVHRLKALYGYSGESFRLWLEGLNALIMNYSKDQSLSAVAALAGHFCGMLAGEGEESVAGPEKVGHPAGFGNFMAFFAHYADPVRNQGARVPH